MDKIEALAAELPLLLSYDGDDQGYVQRRLEEAATALRGTSAQPKTQEVEALLRSARQYVIEEQTNTGTGLLMYGGDLINDLVSCIESGTRTLSEEEIIERCAKVCEDLFESKAWGNPAYALGRKQMREELAAAIRALRRAGNEPEGKK